MSKSKLWWENAETDWTAKEPGRVLDLLCCAYDERDSIKSVVKSAGLDWATAPGGKASSREIWTWALNAASRSRKGGVLDLAVEVLNDRRRGVFHAPLISLLGDQLTRTTLRLLRRHGLPPEDTDAGRQMLESLKGRTEEHLAKSVEALESINMPRQGLQDARTDIQAQLDQMNRTAQIRRGGHPIGTGVLIGNDLLLTAAHVLDAESWPPRDPGEVVAVFEFLTSQASLAETGNKVAVSEYVDASLPTSAEVAGKADKDWNATTDHLDYALLRLVRKVGLEPESCPRGYYRLDASEYDFSHAPRLRMIQHPLGMPQQSCDILQPPKINATGTRIRYKANTHQGSSGSPICDNRGRVVAIHHYSTSQRNQAVPFQAISAALLEGRYRGLFVEKAVPAVPVANDEPPAKRVRINPYTANILAGRPFVNRGPLKDQLKDMVKQQGPRFLAIRGGRRSGKSHSYQLLSYIARESNSNRDLQAVASGCLNAHRIDLRRYRNYPTTERQAAVARAVLGCLTNIAKEQPQDARMLMKVESELKRKFRATDQQWWFFFDSIDDVATAKQDGTAELLETIVDVASDLQHPVRIVLCGREAWALTTDSELQMPYFNEDIAGRIRPAHVIKWVRARAESLGRWVRSSDKEISTEMKQLLTRQLHGREVAPSDIEAKLTEFAGQGLLPDEVAPLLESLVEKLTEE
jgi:hypothetical protein